MPPRQQAIRRWRIGYIALLLASVPLALPCWNGFLRDRIGRYVTIEQVHLLQYLGLGALAAGEILAAEDRRRARWRLILTVAGVGVLDELVQGWLPGRVFQWSDVLLNWAGGLGGGFACWVVCRMAQRLKGGTR
jgi:VanZ family protein